MATDSTTKLPEAVQLQSPHLALGDYLDDMLHRATTAVGDEVAFESNPQASILQGVAEMLYQPLLSDSAEAVTRDALDTTSSSDAPAQAAAKVAQVTKSIEAPAQSGATNPAEFEFPLQCLMFSVGDHRLSVPLIQLSGVVNWNDAITKLPQSPSWLLGLVPYREQKLRVVDSRHLLNIGGSGQSRAKHLLVLGDSGWAITCDRLEQVVSLQRNDIQWPSGANPLILGRIRESLSTLLNPPGICAVLGPQNKG